MSLVLSDSISVCALPSFATDCPRSFASPSRQHLLQYHPTAIASHSTSSSESAGMSSLEVFLSGILPSALQELSASHHLERSQPEASTSTSPSRQLTAHLQRFSYGFAQDERWRRSMFGEGVALPWEDSNVRAGKRPQRDAASSLSSEEQHQQPDSTDEDDDPLEEWTLSGAQARADRDSGGLPSEYSRTRKGKPCGHVFKRGESVYRCK